MKWRIVTTAKDIKRADAGDWIIYSRHKSGSVACLKARALNKRVPPLATRVERFDDASKGWTPFWTYATAA